MRKQKKVPIKDVTLHMQANRAENITIENWQHLPIRKT